MWNFQYSFSLPVQLYPIFSFSPYIIPNTWLYLCTSNKWSGYILWFTFILGHWDNKINCVFLSQPEGHRQSLHICCWCPSFCAYLSCQGKITYASAEDNSSYCDKIRRHIKKDNRAFQSKRRDVFEKRLGEIKIRLHKVEFCIVIKEFINKPLEL